MDFNRAFTINCYVPMFYRFILILFVLSFMVGQATAQNWEDNGAEIEDVRVVIEKDRTIELPAASRNYEKVPPLPAPGKEKPMEYEFKDYNFVLKPLDPRIRVLTIQDEKLNKFYGNYVKAGLGNYATPY